MHTQLRTTATVTTKLLRLLTVLLLLAGCHAHSLDKREMRRRVDFADEHFATAAKIGSLTDRGMVYVVFGPPVRITAIKDSQHGGDSCPIERWEYARMSGVGENVKVFFIDVGLNFNYRMIPSPEANNSAETKRQFVMIKELIHRTIGPTGKEIQKTRLQDDVN